MLVPRQAAEVGVGLPTPGDATEVMRSRGGMGLTRVMRFAPGARLGGIFLARGEEAVGAGAGGEGREKTAGWRSP